MPLRNKLQCILICCFQTPEHQTILFNHGAIQNIAPLLISPSYKVSDSFEHSDFSLQSPVVCPSHSLSSQVQMQALKCCSVLAYENTQVSTTLVNGK